MGVNADILTLALSRQFAVGMAVDMPGTVMGFVPHLEGVVAADDQLFFADIMNHQLQIITATAEEFAVAGMIVIAENKVMLAVEPLENAPRLFRRCKGEIAEVNDDIIFTDDGIVAKNQFFVHFLNILKWPLGVFDDVVVKPMLIPGEEDLAVFELMADFHGFSPA
jgi:hypothetical protein